MGAVGKAWDEVSASFDRFCLAAGIDALGAMMERDAEEACGARHARSEGRRGHRVEALWIRARGTRGRGAYPHDDNLDQNKACGAAWLVDFHPRARHRSFDATFREAYRVRRCIVPVDGFFEGKAFKGQKAKQPYAIAAKDGKPFGIRGI
jgi:SOS response associated peptidase (SRAP)